MTPNDFKNLIIRTAVFWCIAAIVTGLFGINKTVISDIINTVFFSVTLWFMFKSELGKKK